ncbi:MAG: hypothetical protein JF887_01100 [Candidatus Dormibacteraeota bacterium]|uniref:Uncharacterized protein n=1 Tax=Candidatus Amunia macphersoniae TaxID=3127014 RepID=A0A934NFE8_9BACT|nr:hypothetical protein [Candidatus Dormibacteraeota bacterium]
MPSDDTEDGRAGPLRPFRGGSDYRIESPSGLRHEIADLRIEVHRLAAEIDKLWARERGRGVATPARTARSIAGKPVRTGTRASRPGGRLAPPAGASAGPTRPAGTGRAPASRPAGSGSTRSAGAKRTGTGGKRSSGWAKPKSKSRRSGTTPPRRGG